MRKKIIISLILGAMLAATPGMAMAQTMTMDLGSHAAVIDGANYTLEQVAGVNESGQVLVPVRALSKAFQGKVQYIKQENLVKLSFPNGNWADITVMMPNDEEADTVQDTNGSILSVATFMDDRMYIPADLMATCMGARLSVVRDAEGNPYRLIYHVR